jgi:hypothetical protein
MGRVPSGNVPARPIGSILTIVAGLVASGGAIAAEPSVLVVSLASPTLIMGGLFLWLLTQRKTPVGNLAIAVGDSLPELEALTPDGMRFHSRELANRRILLKFFRGSW